MNHFFIASSYSNEDVLNAIYPTCFYSLLIMSIPLLCLIHSKKAAKVSLFALGYVYIPYRLLTSILTMCPHYEEHVFVFFAWMPLLATVIILRKELAVKKHFMLYIFIWCTFMISIRVPFDINRAMKGQMRGYILKQKKMVVEQRNGSNENHSLRSFVSFSSII